MSEDYIIVHKPSSVRASATSVNTPKNSKRKSTNKRTPARKQQDIIQQTSNVLQLAFKQFEHKLEETKQKIHEDLFESVYKNIIDYFDYYLNKRLACKSACSNLTSEDDKLIFNPICHVIPTIALFTGINFQDYASLCDSLGERLKEKFTQNIFWISEQNSQNIKSLSNSIFTQWNNISEDDTKKKIISFRQFFDIVKAEQKSGKDCTPIIFVFKQFELIPRETIENFVSLISCYVENVPIYFMIQLASQTNIIYEQLSSSSISKLCIKRLFFMSPEQYLDKFLTKLFIEQSTMFKLSGDILKFLVEIYYEYNFSISNFIHAIKYCFFDHLQNDSLNLLFICSQIDDFSLYESILSHLSNENKLKGVFSNNDQPSGLQLNSYQNDWIKYNNQFVLICRFLFEIIKHFPSERDDDSLFSMSTKGFSDFYVKICYFCTTNKMNLFTELSQYLKLKNLIQIASNSTINDIVCSFLVLIAKYPMDNQAKYCDDFLDEIVDFSDILEKSKQNFTEIQANELGIEEGDENILDSVNPYEAVEVKSLKSKVSLERRGSLKPSTKKVLGEVNSDLVRRNSLFLAPNPTFLKGLGQKKKLINNLSINFRANMIEWLENQFGIYFNKDYANKDSYSNHFCYTNLVKVKKRLFDVSRINIHNCLFNADTVLKSNKLESYCDDSPKKRTRNSLVLSNPIEINNFMFPLSVVYKIYLECGHMINLYDWLQAYVERMENSDLKELKESKRKLMQALFFRSITELQFMGFIKPTSRKVDHVVKMTNGSCLLTLENEN